MRKSVVIQSAIILVLLVVLGLLNIPKYNQVAPLIMETLVIAGFENINLKPVTLLLIIFILEIVTILINIVILNWIYKTCELNYSVSTNAIIYLISSNLSKVLSLLFPLSVLTTITILPNLIFGFFFMLIHLYINNDISFKQKSWLFGFVITNILISIL